MNASFDQKYLVGAVIGLACLGAVIFAAWIGGADYGFLILASTLVLSAVYFLVLSPYWLLIAFSIMALHFQIYPMGIGVRSNDIMIMLALLFVVSRAWNQKTRERNPMADYFRPFNLCLLLLGIYLTINFWVNWRDPVPGEYVPLGTALKMYALVAGGFVVAWIAIHFTSATKLPKQTMAVCGSILAVTLAINIVIRIYGILFLNLGEREFGTSEVTQTAIMIPIIFAMEHPHALRLLGPMCCLFGIVCLTSKCAAHQTGFMRVLALFLLFGGIFGSLVSMGRAAVLLAVGLIALVLWIRKHYMFFVLLPIATVIGLVVVKFVYEYDPKLVPFPVQRTVAIVPLMDMPEAVTDIRDSTSWRTELAIRAFEEWNSDWRIRLFGRSSLEVTNHDLNSLIRDGYYGGIRMALRKGVTHNVITDLLILVGAVGLLLYFAVYLSLLIGLWRIHRRADRESSSYDWGLISITFIFLTVGYAIIGGMWFEDFQATLFGIAFWVASNTKTTASAELPDEAWTE